MILLPVGLQGQVVAGWYEFWGLDLHHLRKSTGPDRWLGSRARGQRQEKADEIPPQATADRRVVYVTFPPHDLSFLRIATQAETLRSC